MELNSEIKVLSEIARMRDYSLGNAISDATGLGTLYSIGSDMANRARLQTMIKENSAFNGLVQEYLTSSNRSLAGKVAYVGSLTAAGIGWSQGIQMLFRSGLAGMGTMLTIFMLRVGYNAGDRGAFEELEKLSLQPAKDKLV